MRRVSLHPLLLLLVVALLLGARAQTPLVCLTADGALALVAGACRVHVACRFALDVPRMDAAPGAWARLLIDQLGLLAPSAAAALPHDARAQFWDDAAWRAAPLLAADAGDPAARACANGTLDGAPLADDPAALAAVLLALDTLVMSQWLDSAEAVCPDPNSYPVIDNSTGVPAVRCVCAPGKTCSVGTDIDQGLFWAIAILVAVIVGVVSVYLVAASACALRRAGKTRFE